MEKKIRREKRKLEQELNHTTWSMRFMLTRESTHMLEEEQLFVKENGRQVILMNLESDKLMIRLWTWEKDEPLVMEGKVRTGKNGILLRWMGPFVQMWINGILADEEWPIGPCIKGRDVEIGMTEAVDALCITVPAEDAGELAEIKIAQAQYWRPEGCGVGDCMPFFDGERFHVYYLKDRHGHGSKWGLGAHQFAHISADARMNWTQHKLAVEISHSWEGSICTGSVIKAKGMYNAFYAVRMSDRTSARISRAVSTDGINFVKVEHYFSLEAPYETTSARDPEVFQDKYGEYHMLVTTDYQDADNPMRCGCLAHLISKDLENWEQRSPFLVPGYTDQPECSNYFEWNGWHYLIFSNYGFAKYRYSKQPFGPWLTPEEEILDADVFRVPKSAAFFEGRRLLTGFLPDAPDGRSYGGNMIFRELVQHENGELGTCFPPEFLPKQKNTIHSSEIILKEGLSYQTVSLLRTDADFYINAVIRRDNEMAEFGILLKMNGKKAYEIRIEPGYDCAGVYEAHSNPFEKKGRILQQIRTGAEIKLQIRLSKGILDCCFDGRRTLVCRLEGWGLEGIVSLEGFARDTGAVFLLED